MYRFTPQPAANVLELLTCFPVAGNLAGYTFALHVGLTLFSTVCELPDRGYSVLPAHR